MPEPTLLGIGAHAPEKVLTNKDLEKMVDTSDEWIRRRTGIERRHVVSEGESTKTVAAQAALRALEDARLDAETLDWVVVSTDTPEMTNPATACFVQHMIGATHASALDFTGGCAGFLQALDLLAGRAAMGERVLLIGAETLTRIVDWTDRKTCVLFGDGAGAVVIGPDHPGATHHARMLAHTSQTDGSMTNILAVPFGSSLYGYGDPRRAGAGTPAIVMDGQVVFKWAVRRMAEAAGQVCSKAQVALDEVDLVIPHQANTRIIDAVARELHLDPERVFSDVADYGNTGSASIGIALTDALASGHIGQGSLVLLVAFGSGFTWSASLVRF